MRQAQNKWYALDTVQYMYEYTGYRIQCSIKYKHYRE